MTTNSPCTSAAGLTSSTPCSVFLTFDVLFYVMPWIRERKDLYSFIVTCSDLYRTGIPILLGFHYRITTMNLAAFYTFLISKAPSSFLGLRSLDLCFPPWPASAKVDPDGFNMITDILNRAKKLNHIRIIGIVKDRNYEVSAYQTLAALPVLESLDLGDCEDPKDEQRTALDQLRSPLTSLKIQVAVEGCDIITALLNFRRTLQRVIISKSCICRAAPSDFDYPNLVYLELETVSHVQLAVLVPAFPNLQHLTIKYAHDVQEVVALHASNRRFQQEHPNRTWQLSSLSGSVGALYALGLQTIVPVVTITSFLTFLDSDITRLCAVLRQLHPLVLSVEGGNEPIFELDWTADWLAIVIANNCHELVRLNLELAFYNLESVSEHDERFDGLFRELRLVSHSNPALSFLCIDFKAEFEETGEPAYDFLDALDMRSFANRAFLAIPSLKISRFTRGRKDRRSYWQHNENEPKVTHVLPEGLAFMDDLLKEDTESMV